MRPDSFNAPDANDPAAGKSPSKTFATITVVLGPEMRTMARTPGPGADDSATMVSDGSRVNRPPNRPDRR